REAHLQDAIALDHHQYELSISEPPVLLEPGDLLKVSGKLKNISGRDWDIFVDNSETIKIGIQVYEENKPGRLEFRRSLGVDKFFDGATIEFECVIDTKPLQQGKIRLVFDLVAEGRYWFKDKGAKPETITVQVLPETAGNLIKVGNQLKREGKLIEAIANYRHALELNPNLSWLYYNLGDALEKQGNLNQAVTNYYHAIDLNPHSFWFYYRLMEMLYSQGKYYAALGYYKTIIKLPQFKNNFHK
ncbi:tetratricopeptide repeat protein, partial [Planktothrix sp.]|uniref:tetratricopeptide repeat protein n=1 Tax=Planktothrix sp. TaxID=3088171 RepID=UPI0038D3FDCF